MDAAYLRNLRIGDDLGASITTCPRMTVRSFANPFFSIVPFSTT